jgi:hypothetical protein
MDFVPPNGSGTASEPFQVSGFASTWTNPRSVNPAVKSSLVPIAEDRRLAQA